MKLQTHDRVCSKIDTCYKIEVILDKDLLDFQYAEAIENTCSNCSDYEVLTTMKDSVIEARNAYKKAEQEKELAEKAYDEAWEAYYVCRTVYMMARKGCSEEEL